MNFMQYSNEKQINIIPQNEFESLVQEVFNTISSNITKSLGPLGSSATILDGVYTEATKDGYSILNKYRFHNRYKKMIYNLIKAPCTRMNNTVGDGTTTSIALTNAIFNRYKSTKGEFETLYRLPRQFVKAWDDVISEICEEVKANAAPIDPEDYDTIYNIAYVTSNGNHEISDAIASTYKEAKSPNIKQKDSPTNKSYIKAVEGFEFPSNAIDVVYVRNQDLTAEEKDVAVMVFNFKIETDLFNKVLIPINDVMRARGKKLIILAPSYDEYMCEGVLRQYVNHEVQKYGVINLILTQYRQGILSPHQLEDLSVVLRAKPITEILGNGLVEKLSTINPDELVEDILEDETFELYKLIGTADKVLTSCKNGCIFNVSDIEEDKEYKEALIRAESELQDIIDSTDLEKQNIAAKIYEARSRVMQLKMNNYIYYIGADSALQKQIIWDSVEDVIKCLRSSIKYGVVPGCQLTIISACGKLIEKYEEDKLKSSIIEMIRSAALDVYSTILHGPSGLGMIKLVDDWYDLKKFEDEADAEKVKSVFAEYLESTEDEDKKADLLNEQENAINEVMEEMAVRRLREAGRQKGYDIIKKSLEENKAFDLESLDYSDKIITSAETDVMVLTVASELIKILINGNQCIFLDSDINESHNEIVEM
jgi:60 kDa chaperonin